MRIFLDVGAWKGETADAVLHSKHVFDKLYCFEPQLDKCKMIKDRNFDNVEVCDFGLWKETGTSSLFIARHSNGASVYPDKFTEPTVSVPVKMVRATDWFKENIRDDDYVVMKINCEGSECDILDDLLDSGEFKKVSALMVDFDVRKIPSEAHREQETKKKLEAYNTPVLSVEKIDWNRWRHKHAQWTHYWMDKIVK